MGLTSLLNNTNGILQPSPAGLLPGVGVLSTQFQRTDIAYDYAIAGIPFIGGESLRGSYFRKIYQRSFSPIRKDQFDNQQVPGEQSIWGWWLRSQSSFIQGAGTQFLDTSEDNTLSLRYSYSEGVDTLSTPGQVSLLPQAVPVPSLILTGPIKLAAVYNPTFSTHYGALVLDVGAKTLRCITEAGAVATVYTMPGGLTGLANTLTTDGTNYYYADKTGIYKGAIASSAAATLAWNVPSTSGNYVLGWVKGRLVAGLDNNVYELVGGSPPTLPTPKFTHQSSSYIFTDISETQSAIITSGHDANQVSQVHKFVLDSGGALPTLTSGVVCCQMPFGEVILSMYAYIGSFVGIGTNKGFRVGTTDSNGNLTYGPLVVQDPTSTGVQAICGYDRFMLIGNQGNNLIPQQGWVNPSEASSTDGLVKIDLSQVTSTNSQPYANDLMPYDVGGGGYFPASGSPVNSVIVTGTKNSVMWSAGSSLYYTGGPTVTTRVASGYIYTPKIRYNTLEPKHFKYVYMRHQNITDGSIDIYGQNPNMALTSIVAGVTGSSVSASTTPFFISDIGNAQEWFQFKFVLHRGSNNNNSYTPVLNGYQLRALPGVNRQTLIEIPMLCMDHETDRNGVLHGTDGYAFQRLTALEAVTSSGNLVLFQDLNYNTTNLVVVDDYTFEQQSPELAKTSTAGNQDSNAHGGYIILQCRVII
jgi:hypothetical protein